MKIVIQSVFVAVAWAFWGVFGTLFWIALLFRALAAFSIAFLYAMFTDQEPREIQSRLEQLTDLWFRGFRNAYASVFGTVERGSPIEIRNGRLVLEMLWAAIYWYGFLFFSFGDRAVPAFGKLSSEFARLISGLSSVVDAMRKFIESLSSDWRFGLDLIAGSVVAIFLLLAIVVALSTSSEEPKAPGQSKEKAA
jgi:hypothetical protein